MRAFSANPSSQRDALTHLAQLTQRSIRHPLVKVTAHQIVRKVASRDEAAELEAIFAAVKHGDPHVEPLKHGFRYVHDPKLFDSFTAPHISLEAGIRAARAGGAAGGDCDDHAALICGLAGVLGFSVGLRAWKRPGGRDFEHVYAVAALPKFRGSPRWFGLDTTVPKSFVGWEPPKGDVLTAVVVGSTEN